MKEPMKVIAYTDQHNNETVTALQAQMLGLDVVYSCHKPGERLEMYKTRRKQTHYFAYKSTTTHEGKTAPETLTHTLCKQIIAELAHLPTPMVSPTGRLPGGPGRRCRSGAQPGM